MPVPPREALARVRQHRVKKSRAALLRRHGRSTSVSGPIRAGGRPCRVRPIAAIPSPTVQFRPICPTTTRQFMRAIGSDRQKSGLSAWGSSASAPAGCSRGFSAQMNSNQAPGNTNNSAKRVSYDGGPGSGGCTFFLNDEFDLEVLARILWIEVKWLHPRWEPEILLGIPFQGKQSGRDRSVPAPGRREHSTKCRIHFAAGGFPLAGLIPKYE